MKLRHVYLTLSLLGILIPFFFFLPWLTENGVDLPLFFSELFSTRVGGFFGLDVFVSAAVLFVFVAVEGRRVAASARWLAVAVTLACGVSAGLPLFLYLRQRTRDAGLDRSG
ncbi:MAG TPA: DUF2834 domain-containing protein [Gemmatimonadota bacterium]|nr:DUF2834 domain-containing protein [Gemmatimonadota bacterium]